LAALIGSFITTGAAQAAPVGGGHDANSVETVYLGDTVDLDYTCPSGADPLAQLDNSHGGEIPPGLVWDSSTAHITGVPTEAGTYSLPFFSCHYPANNIIATSSFGSIVVDKHDSPTPFFTATAETNMFCTVRLIGVMPVDPEPGTAKVIISANGDTSTLWLNHSFGANQPFDLTLPMSNSSWISGAAGVADWTPGNVTDFCGLATTFEFVYNAVDSADSSVSQTVRPSNYSGPPPYDETPNPNISVFQTNNEHCDFLVYGSLPALADPGSVSLMIASGHNTVWADLQDFGPSDLIALAVHGDDLTSLQFNSQVNNLDITNAATTNFCGQSVRVMLLYQTQGLPTGSSFEDVDLQSATAGQPCELGTFSLTGTMPCTPSPIGSFVPAIGATSATPCPAGNTTLLTGARSHFECFKVITQTIKAVTLPTKLKFKATALTPTTTDLGAPLTLAASGPCSFKTVQVPVKVGKKTTRVAKYQITAGSVAGVCSLTYTNAGDDTHSPLSVVRTVKVAKK